MEYREELAYYCEECNKIYNRCYELSGISMCVTCWSENIRILNEKEIKSFIRNKRLKRLNDISNI